MNEATALAIFGDYWQFGSYMMSLSSHRDLRSMLNNIKSTADPTTRLVTLLVERIAEHQHRGYVGRLFAG